MRITGGGGGRVADRERLRRIGGRLLAAPRGAVGLFALSSLVAIGAVGAFLFVQISRSSDAASLRTSQVVSRVIGHAVVEPLVDDRLLAGNPDAAAAFTSGIRAHMSDRYVVAVELVTLTGRIVYAGDRSRVGSVRALPVEARQALAGRSVARDGIGVGDAVSGGITVRTVWQVIHAHPSGAPVLLETLLRHDVIAARTARTWRPLLIALVAALVALWLVQIPVAVAITRSPLPGAG